MKATSYNGAHDVRVDSVSGPILRDATDAIVCPARAAVCGYVAMDDRHAVQVLWEIS